MTTHTLTRRELVRRGVLSLSCLGIGVKLTACDGDDSTPRPVPTASNLPTLGPLQAADANGLRLPAGFTGRVVARVDEALGPRAELYLASPDGAATYPTRDGGFIYCVNSEAVFGGVSAIRFDRDGEITDYYGVATETAMNCSGGKMPWGTWMTCEETLTGRVLECDPHGVDAPVHYPALGLFAHEAVAYDEVNHHLYLTEDRPDGRFYRFRSTGRVDGHADFTAGTLEVLRVLSGTTGACEWLPIDDPSGATVATRLQQATSTAFNGGEGVYVHAGKVYFTTKGDNRIWSYTFATSTLDVVYDASTHPAGTLTGVDNVIVTPFGELIVAEDGGDMQVVAVMPNGDLVTLAQVEGHTGSEITGIAFDPNFERFLFSSQRGATGTGKGMTFLVEGPFFQFA